MLTANPVQGPKVVFEGPIFGHFWQTSAWRQGRPCTKSPPLAPWGWWLSHLEAHQHPWPRPTTKRLPQAPCLFAFEGPHLGAGCKWPLVHRGAFKPESAGTRQQGATKPRDFLVNPPGGPRLALKYFFENRPLPTPPQEPNLIKMAP